MERSILAVEDNDDDWFFLKRALAKAGAAEGLHCASTGQMALDYFEGRGPFADRKLYPLPCLVLLDLKIPEVPGIEVLKWIRSHTAYHSIPVVILSSSTQEVDIDAAYHYGANSYLVKPPNIEALVELARLVTAYWLGTNRPPSVCRGA